jgi:hypothetical protein
MLITVFLVVPAEINQIKGNYPLLRYIYPLGVSF